jgi:hypothetical protein
MKGKKCNFAMWHNPLYALVASDVLVVNICFFDVLLTILCLTKSAVYLKLCHCGTKGQAGRETRDDNVKCWLGFNGD